MPSGETLTVAAGSPSGERSGRPSPAARRREASRRGEPIAATAVVCGLALAVAGVGHGQGVIVLEGGGVRIEGGARVTLQDGRLEVEVRQEPPVAELDEPAVVEPDAAEQPLVERLLDGLRQAVPAVVADGAFGGGPAEIARRQAITERTRQIEQHLMPLLHVELEHVRRHCGSLEPTARREVLAAGRRAVREIAAAHAAAAIDDRPPPGVVREELQARVAAAVRTRAPAAEFTRYERETGMRRARRAERARIRIVGIVDERLDLTAAQRAAMLADLRGRWQPAWVRQLDVPDAAQVAEFQPAPDFADACISPHLDAVQRAAWREWCAAAGIDQIGWDTLPSVQHNVPQPAAWWTP